MNTHHAERYLKTLFGQAIEQDWLDGYYITIFDLTLKRSRSIPINDITIPIIVNLNHDTYTHMGLTQQPYSGNTRPSESEIECITSLWMDIDFASNVKKQDNLPKTLGDAIRLAHKVLKPSMLIETGHGIHAYWILHEPISITNENKFHVKSILKQWQELHRSISKMHIDPTHDLSRIMRLPGSKNNKNKQEPVLCEINRINENVLYNLSDIEEYLERHGEVKEECVDTYVNDVDYSEDRTDPNFYNMLTAILANNPTFKLTWDHARTDFEDQSPSAYDFSLAIQAIYSSWSDQNIITLLKAFRKTHEFDLKENRKDDYYKRTLAKARIQVEQESKERNEKKSALIEAGNTDSNISRKYIKVKIDIDIKHVERFINEDTCLYTVVLNDDTKIAINDPAVILSQAKFGNKVWEKTGRFPLAIKRKEWKDILSHMANLFIDFEMNEASNKERTEHYIKAYTNNANTDRDSSIITNRPFIESNTLFIHAEQFYRFICDRGFRLSAMELRQNLKNLGFTCEQIYSTEHRNLRPRYWKLKNYVMLGETSIAHEDGEPHQ